MKNKYKSAGIWNIFCGVLFTIAYIVPIVCLGVKMFDWGDIAVSVVYFSILLFFAACVWEGAYIMFPFFMILTGSEMISRRKKGAGVKALIVFNVLFKILGAIYNGCFCYYLFLTVTPVELTFVISGVALIVTAALILVSVVMDFRALFQRNKVA